MRGLLSKITRWIAPLGFGSYCFTPLVVFQTTALELQRGVVLHSTFVGAVSDSRLHPVRILLRFDHLIPRSLLRGVLGLLGATILRASTTLILRQHILGLSPTLVNSS